MRYRTPKSIEYSENDLNRARDMEREELGDTCEECGGQIATDRTPKWVYRERDICDCPGAYDGTSEPS